MVEQLKNVIFDSLCILYDENNEEEKEIVLNQIAKLIQAFNDIQSRYLVLKGYCGYMEDLK